MAWWPKSLTVLKFTAHCKKHHCWHINLVILLRSAWNEGPKPSKSPQTNCLGAAIHRPMCRLETDRNQKALFKRDFFNLMLMLLHFGWGVSYLRHWLRLAALNQHHKGLLLRFAQQSRQEAVKDKEQRCILTFDPYILTSPAIWHEALST